MTEPSSSSRRKSQHEWLDVPSTSSQTLSEPDPTTPQSNKSTVSNGSDRKAKREIANLNERKRMQNINAGFDRLRQLVPGCRTDKLSKASILQLTTQYISHLQASEMALKQQLLAMKSQLATPQSRTQHYPKIETSSPPTPVVSTIHQSLQTTVPSAVRTLKHAFDNTQKTPSKPVHHTPLRPPQQQPPTTQGLPDLLPRQGMAFRQQLAQAHPSQHQQQQIQQQVLQERYLQQMYAARQYALLNSSNQRKNSVSFQQTAYQTTTPNKSTTLDEPPVKKAKKESPTTPSVQLGSGLSSPARRKALKQATQNLDVIFQAIQHVETPENKAKGSKATTSPLSLAEPSSQPSEPTSQPSEPTSQPSEPTSQPSEVSDDDNSCRTPDFKSPETVQTFPTTTSASSTLSSPKRRLVMTS